VRLAIAAGLVMIAACRARDAGPQAKAPPSQASIVPPSIVPRWSTDSAQGIWVPPHFPGEGIDVPATVSQDWMTTLQIGAQEIVFEKTPLDSLQLRLHAGPMGHTGDAGDFVQWLCFTGGIAQNRWVLWLDAGEMDAGDVAGFHMVAVPPDAQVDHRCSELQPVDTPVLPKGLNVGLDDSTVHRLLGPPSTVVGDTSIYYFQRKPPAKPVGTRVILVTERGRVVQVAAWRSSAF
jgi:hypothetical protein